MNRSQRRAKARKIKKSKYRGYVSIEYKDVAAFSVLIVVLIFFPTGFLGKPDIEKV